MAEADVRGFFESLEEKLNRDPSRIAGMNAVYQFRVGNESYHVGFASGKASVGAGEAPSPGCTVSMGEDDFLELLSGRLNGQMAFMTGKLKVAGDFGLALKLETFLKR